MYLRYIISYIWTVNNNTQHLSTHSVIAVTWVYTLASADTNTPPQSKCIPSNSQRASKVFTGRAFMKMSAIIWLVGQ